VQVVVVVVTIVVITVKAMRVNSDICRKEKAFSLTLMTSWNRCNNRCFSYDGAISSRLVSGKKKRERITKTAITTTQSGSVSSIKDATASEKKELGDLKNKRRKKSKREECRRRKDYYYGAVECDGSVQSSKRLLGAKEKSTKQINKHPKVKRVVTYALFLHTTTHVLSLNLISFPSR